MVTKAQGPAGGHAQAVQHADHVLLSFQTGLGFGGLSVLTYLLL